MGRQIGVLLLVTLISVSNASEPQEASIERWDRVVCLHTERKATDGLPAFASASPSPHPSPHNIDALAIGDGKRSVVNTLGERGQELIRKENCVDTNALWERVG